MSAAAASMLSVQGLSTAIGASGPEILSDVSLQVAPGEVLGVVGESGSGKSMLALSIMGLLPHPIRVRSGRILLQGQDLATLPAARLRAMRGKDMAMIFQEPMTSLNPVMRVGQQLAEVLHFKLGMDARAARTEGIALLRRVELPEPERRIDAYPHELSGGQRQRVMIAMALAGKPRLLIADEPTTALDVTIQAQILELVRRIQRDEGMAVLLITHDLGVIAEMCDRVAVMYAGRVVETGAVLDLFDRPAHPYTRGLLASRPSIAAGAQWLATIEGTVPAVGEAGPGCSFAPRCVLAHEACRGAVPLLSTVGAGHAAACFVAQAQAAEEAPQPVAAEVQA